MKTVCKRSDLAEGRLTPVLDGRLVITLIQGDPIAVSGRCPHQGAALEHGQITGRVVATANNAVDVDTTCPVLRCPWHGFEYDLASGLPLAGEPGHRRMRLRRFKAHIEGDNVMVEI